MAGKATPSTALAVVDPQKYPVLSGEGDGGDITEIIAENFGDDGISPFDLDRVAMPAGGGTTWEVPSLDGELALKTLEGVIVAWTKPRVFWEVSLDDQEGDAQPPDCSSDDGEYGDGQYGRGSELHPSGDCASCPMNQWGSASGDRKGKGCKETRLLFMLLEDGLLPVTVSLPPTSIQPLRKYFLRLASGRVPFYGVTTKLSLRKVDGSGAIKYAVVEPALGERLDPDLKAAAKEYGETFKTMQTAGAARVAADEYQKGSAEE